MVKEGNEHLLMLLRKDVEERCEFKVHTSHDFERLAETITNSGVGYISSSTLKRLWGYVKDTRGKRQATLDILARYIGYPKGFSEFESTVSAHSLVESGFDKKRVLDVLSLAPGTLVEVEWMPNRTVILCSLGSCILEVTESINAKLAPGMRVCCSRIIEGEKLMVDIIDGSNSKPLVYEAGKINGVIWKIIKGKAT